MKRTINIVDVINMMLVIIITIIFIVLAFMGRDKNWPNDVVNLFGWQLEEEEMEGL